LGEGPDFDRLINLIQEASIAKHFRLLGKVDNISHQLTKINILVAPSRSEAFGLSPLEALSVGCFVVCFDVGGLKESVGRCEQAFLIKPFDISQMAKSIENIWLNNEFSEFTSLSAHNFILNNFSVDLFISKLEQYIYSKL